MDKDQELEEGGDVTLYLLTRMLSIASSNETLMQQILDAGVRLMFKGQPPGEGNSSVCGRTWGPGTMAYRCVDCQATPSSCICVDCFKHGAHEGHDYHVYTSGYGGCCDCGDPAAWKPKGFCAKHSRSSSEQSAENFDVEAAQTLLDNVLQVLHSQLSSYLRYEDKVGGITAILQFISKVCSFGDVPRAVMAKSLLAYGESDQVSKAPDAMPADEHMLEYARLMTARVINGPASLSDLLLVACAEARDDVHTQVIKVFMDLNYDAGFKEEFARRFFDYYPLFIANSYLPTKVKTIYRDLSAITAQLLNFPDLVTRLVRENGLYAILIKCLEDFFEQCSVRHDRPEVAEGEESMETEEAPTEAASSGGSEGRGAGSGDSGEISPPMAPEGGRGRKVVNLREPSLRANKSPWERVIIDLEMAIGLPGTGRLLTLGLPGLFAKWQHILALLHGMDVNKRKMGQHVEYELDDWRTAFYLDMQTFGVIDPLATDLKRAVEEEAAGGDSTHGKEVVAWPQIHALIREQVRFLLELVRTDGVAWETATLRALYYPADASHELRSIRWSPERDGASFHIPLHRNLAAFVHSIATAVSSASSSESLKDSVSVADLFGIESKQDALLLLEHPLRCHLLLAQIEADMWRRNGDHTMHGQARWYKSSYLFGKVAQCDLLAIQCGAVLLGAEDFVATLVHRFGLLDYFGLRSHGTTPGEEEGGVTDEQRRLLAEEFFRFVLQVVTNRAMISSENSLRKQIIQWLAAGNQVTHSKLLKQVSYEKLSNKDVEQVLAEVAVFVRPQAGKQGYFQLKPEYWNEFNPYFLHFSHTDLNTATENYHLAIKGKALLPIATPSVPYSMFSDIDDILRSPLVHSLLFTVLHNASIKSSRYSESMLDAALHLLTLCLRLEKVDRSDACAQDVAVDQREDETSVCTKRRRSGPHLGTDYTSGPFSLLDRLKLKAQPPAAAAAGQVSQEEGSSRTEVSMLELIIGLRKTNELAEENAYLDQLIGFLREWDDACARAIEASFEDPNRETKAKTARERARERILAQMKKKQQAFMDKTSQAQNKADADDGVAMAEEGRGAEEEEGAKEETAPPVYRDHPNAECVLCKESKPWEDHPLGLIGSVKRSRLLSLAKRQPIRLENWRRVFTEEIERAKGKEGKDKDKDLPPTDDETIPGPLGVHITAKELKELMELWRGFLEESPLMVSVSNFDGISTNPQFLDLFLDTYAREVRAGNSQPITDDYVHRHAHDHHEAVQTGEPRPSSVGTSTSGAELGEPGYGPPSSLYADFDQTSVLIQSCGHTIHFDCWEGYLEARLASRRHYGSTEDMMLSETFQEFWCPQCRRLSNVLIPLIPSPLAPAPSPLTDLDVGFGAPKLQRESYEPWLRRFLESGRTSPEEPIATEDHNDDVYDDVYDEDYSEEEEVEEAEGIEQMEEMTDSDLPSLERFSDDDDDHVLREAFDPEWLEPVQGGAAGELTPRAWDAEEAAGEEAVEEEEEEEEMSQVEAGAQAGAGEGDEEQGEGEKEEAEEGEGAGQLMETEETDGREADEGEGEEKGEDEYGEDEMEKGEEEQEDEEVEGGGEGDAGAPSSSWPPQSEEEKAAAKAYDDLKAAQWKMRVLASRFTRHLFSVKKYRRKPSPVLMRYEEPLYLLANLSYSIAALELSLRSAVALHDPQDTDASSPHHLGGAGSQSHVMRHFTLLSERRYAHFKDVYSIAQVGLDLRPSRRRHWMRLIRNTMRGVANNVGHHSPKPLLTSDIFPLLTTWLALERSSSAEAPSHSAARAGSQVVAPFVHVALTAAVTQTLLSLLRYGQRSPGEDDDDLARKESASDEADDDIGSLLRLLRTSMRESQRAAAMAEEGSDEGMSGMPGMPRLSAALPSLDVLEGRTPDAKRTAAARLLARRSISDLPSSSSSSSSSSSTSDPLIRFVKAHAVPLLRRTALFLAICHDLPLAPLLAALEGGGGVGAGEEDPLSAEFDALAAFLGLPRLESLLFGGCAAPLVEGWWRHLCGPTIHAAGPAVVTIPSVASPAPFKLIELPHLFQDVFHAYLDKKCPKCNTQPSKPAICLLCGTLLCAESDCCAQTRCGECSRHAIMCGGGVGIFLLAKTSGVVLIVEDKSCLWGSPYFDQYGEEDIRLERGANLFLDRSVYGQLNQLLVEHQLEGEILRSDVPLLKRAQPARKW